MSSLSKLKGFVLLTCGALAPVGLNDHRSFTALAKANHLPSPPTPQPGRWPIANQLPALASPKSRDEEEARVRIGLRLSIHNKRIKKNLGVIKQTAETRLYTLRCHLLESNHFYLDQFHIHTTPLRWNRLNNFYETKLNFYARFGEHGEVEERLGSLELKGYLKGKDKLYIVHGVASSVFKDAFNRPLLEVVAGYNPAAEPKENLARSHEFYQKTHASSSTLD